MHLDDGPWLVDNLDWVIRPHGVTADEVVRPSLDETVRMVESSDLFEVLAHIHYRCVAGWQVDSDASAARRAAASIERRGALDGACLLTRARLGAFGRRCGPKHARWPHERRPDGAVRGGGQGRPKRDSVSDRRRLELVEQSPSAACHHRTDRTKPPPKRGLLRFFRWE